MNEMNEPLQIRVAEVVGGPRGIDAADGAKVYEEVLTVLKAGQRVRLSFEGISMVITAFLNESVGKLYGALPSKQVDEMLEIIDLLPAFQTSLEKSIEWSKAYYADPEGMGRALLEDPEDAE
jgi:hypothetical protein